MATIDLDTISTSDLLLRRYTSDGQADAPFGVAGVVNTMAQA